MVVCRLGRGKQQGEGTVLVCVLLVRGARHQRCSMWLRLYTDYCDSLSDVEEAFIDLV